MTGSAPPSGGSRGRPFLRPMRERSALHHDAPSRSGVPAALPQSQGLRPLSLVHLLLLADAKNPRRRLARTARSSAGGGPTPLRRVHRRTDMTRRRRALAVGWRSWTGSSARARLTVWRAEAGVCRGIFDVAGPSLPVVLGGLGACFPGLPEGLVFPAAGVFSPMLPGASGHPSGPAFRAALTGAFLPFLPGVFRSGGERRRPRARRKITGPQKTGLCKKNARGSPATGCRVSRRDSVQ